MSYTRLEEPSSTIQPPPSYFSMANFPIKATHPSAKRTMDGTRRKKLVWSYAPDWILTIVLAALFFSLDTVEGYRRQFSLSDETLRYPYAVHERVPNSALIGIAVLAPFVIMLLVNFITVRSLWDFHNGTLGLIFALALTGSFTQVVKITVGRPRPDIISRCQPPEGLTDPPFGLTDWTVCTQTDAHIMRDGFRSFFSGHSSLSFAGLGFLAFYLAGKLHLFDSRGHTGKAWLAVSPFMAASLVAISRTMDYRHHWQDVLIGSFVGTTFAYFSYRQYYPSLESAVSHRPYSPRIKRDDEVLPTHTNGNPFVHQNKPADDGHPHAPIGQGQYEQHSNEGSFDGHAGYGGDYELAGTVPRPSGVGSLEHAWKESSGDGERTAVPRTAGPGNSALPTVPTLQVPDPTESPVRPTGQPEARF